MTTRQYLALQSAKATSAKFHRHRDEFSNNEGLVHEVDRLDLMISRVMNLAKEQAAATKGLTVENGKVREELAETLLEVGGIGEGWAAAKGNEVLRAKLAVTATGLAGLGLKIEVVAPAILEAAQEAASLGADKYGLTPDLLDDLAAQLQRLSVAPTVRDFRDERKTVTSELSAALIELMTFLRDVIDPLMQGYRRRKPRFFEEYRNARRIGGRKAKEEQPAAPAAAEATTTRPLASPADPASTAQMQAEGIVLDQDSEADAELDKVLAGDAVAEPKLARNEDAAGMNGGLSASGPMKLPG